MAGMEVAVAALAIAVVVLAGALAFALGRRGPADAETDATGRALEVASRDRTVSTARREFAVVPTGAAYELRLSNMPLLEMTPISYDELPARTRVSSTYAEWIGSLLDNPRVLEFIAGQRWVLAKVPDAIRQGGTWMKSGETLKAVARGPGTSQFGGIADLVGTGAALGTVTALGPAVIGAAAAAYAHHQINSAVQNVHVRLVQMDRRFRDADMGVITGGRRLVEDMAEWGPPHLWPQQLRYELAVRRAALDPVCFAQQREVERLVGEMLKKGETFVGLDAQDRDRLQQETAVLGLATMVKAQLDFTTTMVLLDCEAAPFGLERLALTSQTFAHEMNDLGASLQAAIEGRRPRLVAPRSYLRAKATAPAIEYLLEEIGRVTSSVGEPGQAELVLTVGSAGELEAAVPLDLDAPGAEPDVDVDASDGGTPGRDEAQDTDEAERGERIDNDGDASWPADGAGE